MRSLHTTCCISGGGPAGIMLGYLLARSGIDVTVLEKWPDFFRDFRGDTIHPSTTQLLKELGLLERFLKLPHDETKQIAVHIGGKEVVLADFTHLTIGAPFVAFMPQWDFLNFIAEEAKRYPAFHLLMETEAIELIRENGKVVGVRAKDKEGEFDIRAELTVGADGRHSTVRDKSGLVVKDSGTPIDVLWFKLARQEDGTAMSLGYINAGRMMVLLDRTTYWQCAFIIKKGGFDSIKEQGMQKFQESIAHLVPLLAESSKELTDWNQVKMLSVAVDHLQTWYSPGLVCIGDAAHAMSPVGGVGINLAIQDAVAAANILVPAFARKGGVRITDLQAIQRRRARPAGVIQNIQVFIHTHILERVLDGKATARIPWLLTVIDSFPYLRRLPAYLIGVGIRPEHIKTTYIPILEHPDT